MSQILIASDHGGFNLKEKLIAYLKKQKVRVKDLGTYSADRCDYPQTAYRLAKLISDGRYQRGILICKSGIGNSIVANKLPKVRAALCYNLKAAKLSRKHNDSNILVLGSVFVKTDLARRMVSAWLRTDFSAGRHLKRLKQISAIEKMIRSGVK